MANTKLYLDLRSRAKDGKGTILIMIIHNRTSASISTGIRISPDEWNGRNIKQGSPNFALNAKLIEQKAKVDKDIALLMINEDVESMSAAEIKVNIVNPSPVKNSGHLLTDLFHEYTSNGMENGTKLIYKSTLKKVTSFAGESVTIEEVNLKWIYQFEKYLSATQGPNGRAIYLRSLKAICNYAKHIGVVSGYPFENFKIKYEPTRKRCIDVVTFREFCKCPVSEPTNKYRDYFILIFLLIGVNVKDLLLARPNQLVEGRFEYIRAKTHKKYSIKVEPEAQALLDKYKGKDYLLEAMDHCKHHTNFARQINEFCQQVGPVVEDQEELFSDKKKIEPIIPGITTYFARHSWATFAYEAGVPIDVISQALGHSMGNKTTLIYIKPDQSKVDRANRMVINYTLNGIKDQWTNPL